MVSKVYSFKTFQTKDMKKRPNETDSDFDKRCQKVWQKLCEDADKCGVVQFKDEEEDDDEERYDFDEQLESKIEDLVEEVDDE